MTEEHAEKVALSFHAVKVSGVVAFVLLMLVAVTGAQPESEPDVRRAVKKALPLLQKSATAFTSQRSCFSCHHNALPILTLHFVGKRGFDVDDAALRSIEEKSFHTLRGEDALDEAIQGSNLSDPTPNDSYLLMAAEAAGLPPDPVTGVYARRIATWQREGHWSTSDFRPPHSSSLFTATATAVKAMRAYMPVTFAPERDAALGRAWRWLADTKPASTEDAAFRLMGLAWVGAPKADVESAGRDLLSLQRKDGGWGQTPRYDSDAYSTGEAVFALREAGIEAAAFRQKAVSFLLSTQAKNGTWRVRTRMVSPAEVSPPYFSTGFPYKGDEFLSYAGTCWAVMALASTLPERTGAGGPTATPPPPASWMQAALSNSVRDLEAVFRSGVDPNSRTSGGVTALMAAAPDVEMVRVLLARGADVRLRTGDGVDALTVAATYRGTSASVAALLDAGVLAEPPEGSHVRRAPIVLAAMTGDVETARLLLARGAKPSAEALSEAVTFGNTEVARMLVMAGADATGTESSGINLMHWATITGRPEVIPFLAYAGVPINARDQFGFTPLMYAATLDTGPRTLIPALLKAGADRQIKNKNGRTPLEQARSLKRLEAIDALK